MDISYPMDVFLLFHLFYKKCQVMMHSKHCMSSDRPWAKLEIFLGILYIFFEQKYQNTILNGVEIIIPRNEVRGDIEIEGVLPFVLSCVRVIIP